MFGLPALMAQIANLDLEKMKQDFQEFLFHVKQKVDATDERLSRIEKKLGIVESEITDVEIKNEVEK